MSHIRYVTLTGVDAKTDFSEMQRLSAKYPYAEWAVQYSPERAGKENQFPSLDWIQDFARKAAKAKLYIALHLSDVAVAQMCKAVGANIQGSDPRYADALALFAIAETFGRVQLGINAKASRSNEYVAIVRKLLRTEMRTRVILPYNDFSEKAFEDIRSILASYEVFDTVFDSSEGRPIAPRDWPEVPPILVRRPGFAGGLGPHNIGVELPKIAAKAEGKVFGVTVEHNLRDSAGWFNCDAAADVLAQTYQFIQAQENAIGAQYGAGTKKVEQLNELWLDWWVGHAMGYPMIVPPSNASRPVYVYRNDGTYEGFNPSVEHAAALKLLTDEQIGLDPTEDGKWVGQSILPGKPAMVGRSLVEAGLKAIVAKHFGSEVPKNPAEALFTTLAPATAKRRAPKP